MRRGDNETRVRSSPYPIVSLSPCLPLPPLRAHDLRPKSQCRGCGGTGVVKLAGLVPCPICRQHGGPPPMPQLPRRYRLVDWRADDGAIAAELGVTTQAVNRARQRCFKLMTKQEYMPQWRALAGAKAILGDDAKIWKSRTHFHVGLPVDGARGPGRRLMRTYGRGLNWREALAEAAAVKKLETLNTKH